MPVRAQLDAQVPDSVQGSVLTWTAPYRVGCISITTAFAAGFDEAFCAQGCKATRASPYFNSNSQRPFADLGWRPAMMLAGETLDAVKALIDRNLNGETLLEAYWKSVEWPGQGVFIGEPLAAPFR